MFSSRGNRILVLLFCFAAAAAFGVSAYDSNSNSPTYVPPGLHLVDPTFLAHDWWLQGASHYHAAFFALVALLDRLGVVEPALGLLNIVVVAGFLYVSYMLAREWRSRQPGLALAFFVAMFFATNSFVSVGASYLFSQSLQPSAISAAATAIALLCFVRRRWGSAGLCLALAGVFHVNFLLVNAPLFGIAYLIAALLDRKAGFMAVKPVLWGGLWLMLPSLVVLVGFMPLILSVERDVVDSSVSEKADWIFFQFAVPFHYLPLTYLPHFVGLLTWELLGAAWTPIAVPAPAQRRIVWALQAAFAVVIWGATALTTVVFVNEVSRLYFWRLAPFVAMLSALLTIVGYLRFIPDDAGEMIRPRGLVPVLTFGLAVAQVGSVGNGISLQARLLELAVLFVLAGVAVLGWLGWASERRKFLAGATWVAALLAVAATALTLRDYDDRGRYSLIVHTDAAKDENALYAFVKNSTPVNSLFVVPPRGLDYFRLCGQRAVVVDWKALPLNKMMVLDWYDRLKNISGTINPKDISAVSAGYLALDASRLRALRDNYGITHAVLGVRQSVHDDNWREIYRNGQFYVLEYIPH